MILIMLAVIQFGDASPSYDHNARFQLLIWFFKSSYILRRPKIWKNLLTFLNILSSERVTADDVTVRPWPGGKYDLIQLHRQIRHQNARNLFFTTKLSLPPAIKIKILRKQWKCLCSDVICRLSSLFNILGINISGISWKCKQKNMTVFWR